MTPRRPLGGSTSLAGFVSLTLVVLVSIVGCTKDAPDAKNPAPGEVSGLTVSSHGAAPRRALKLALTKGDTTTLEVKVAIGLTRTGGASPVTPGLPSVVEKIRFLVTAVDEERATVTFEVTDAQLDRSGTELTDLEFVRLTAATQQVVGVSGVVTVPASGSATRVRIKVPAGASAELRATLADLDDQISRIVPPFPRAAVGKGARWRVVDEVRSAGAVVKRTTTYRIVRITDRGVDYEATVSQTSDSDGSKTSVSGTTTGTFSLIDLASSSETSLTGTTTGQKTTMKITVGPAR